MFIRHCPNPELSLIFKCRPVDQWTASDIQELLDEYRRERRISHAAGMLPAVVTSLRQEVGAATSLPFPHPSAVSVQSPPPSSNEPMDRLLTLLERVLVQRPYRADRQPRMGNRQGVQATGPCEVCGSMEHEAYSHCRANRLCFLCFSPGHGRWQYPRDGAQQPGDGGNATSATQSQEN